MAAFYPVFSQTGLRYCGPTAEEACICFVPCLKQTYDGLASSGK